MQELGFGTRPPPHQLVVVPVVARVEASIRDLNVRAAIAGFRLEPSDSTKSTSMSAFPIPQIGNSLTRRVTVMWLLTSKTVNLLPSTLHTNLARASTGRETERSARVEAARQRNAAAVAVAACAGSEFVGERTAVFKIDEGDLDVPGQSHEIGRHLADRLASRLGIGNQEDDDVTVTEILDAPESQDTLTWTRERDDRGTWPVSRSRITWGPSSTGGRPKTEKGNGAGRWLPPTRVGVAVLRNCRMD